MVRDQLERVGAGVAGPLLAELDQLRDEVRLRRDRQLRVGVQHQPQQRGARAGHADDEWGGRRSRPGDDSSRPPADPREGRRSHGTSVSGAGRAIAREHPPQIANRTGPGGDRRRGGGCSLRDPRAPELRPRRGGHAARPASQPERDLARDRGHGAQPAPLLLPRVAVDPARGHGRGRSALAVGAVRRADDSRRVPLRARARRPPRRAHRGGPRRAQPLPRLVLAGGAQLRVVRLPLSMGAIRVPASDARTVAPGPRALGARLGPGARVALLRGVPGRARGPGSRRARAAPSLGRCGCRRGHRRGDGPRAARGGAGRQRGRRVGVPALAAGVGGLRLRGRARRQRRSRTASRERPGCRSCAPSPSPSRWPWSCSAWRSSSARPWARRIAGAG